MAIDLTVGLLNQPGTLLRATNTLGRAGLNIDGACGFVCDGQGVFHVLVDDAERARRALIDAGLEIRAERAVVVTTVENRPGGAAAILRRVSDANVNIDLLYVTVDGQLVLGGDDVPGLQRTIS